MHTSGLPTPYRAVDGSFALLYLDDFSVLKPLADFSKLQIISVFNSKASPHDLLVPPHSIEYVPTYYSTALEHLDLSNEVKTVLLETMGYTKRLITRDESILNLRPILNDLGLEVLLPEEYSEMVNARIKDRDEYASFYSSQTNTALPDWVGKDRLEF